ASVPYERLLSVDARLEGAAARPVIAPQTVVVDQDKVFVSSSFIAACGSLGISVQPAPPGNGPAKGNVERTFGSIGTLFVQHVAAYTASHTGDRGKDVEGEAVWTLAQLAEMFEEWVVCGWQERRHDGLRHPMMPRCALSPNEMWGALVAVCGYVPVPLGRDDYIELMPVKRQKINDYGVRIGYRTYDHAVLNPYRGQRSPAADGLWEIHYNPHAPGQVWVRLPEPGRPRGYGWEAVPWVHRTLVSAPFTDFTWRYLRRTVAGRADRAGHEHDLALALRELLERAAAGHGTRREKVVAARARAAGSGSTVWGVLYGGLEDAGGGPDDAFDDGGEADTADMWEEDGDAEEADDVGRGRPAEPEPGPLGVYDPWAEALGW
ncbi:MAG TPA: Mu transposase C-terminal domain-containing protein, partial [Yinghuangia sp.]|nr:Mu transposase C-terminal domain-containing protein [Yinghuangia sp.]